MVFIVTISNHVSKILHSNDLPYPVCFGSSSRNILDNGNDSDAEVKSISSNSSEFSLQGKTPYLIKC